MSLVMRLAVGVGVLILVAGCGLVPQIAHQPTYHNPFPQLTKVAVAPFFNLSAEPTVDGRQFAGAYLNELQSIPGFEVVPFPVVEEKIKELGLALTNPVEVRKLAEVLEVDAVVIGAVTDFSPYYPPRCAIQVEWYTANPCFHPIPVGYGLPWGTTEEEYIPETLVLETEFGLAREQLKTQTPAVANDGLIPVRNEQRPKSGNLMAMLSARDHMAASTAKARDDAANRTAAQPKQYAGQQLSYQHPAMATDTASASRPTPARPGGVISPRRTNSELTLQHGALPSVVVSRSKSMPASAAVKEEKNDSSPVAERENKIVDPPAPGPSGAAPGPLPLGSGAVPIPMVAGGVTAASLTTELPLDWPDPRGLVPPPPAAHCADCRPTYEPVLRHTRAYNGNDVRFTTALESYVFFRDDARLGGWQSYLQRSDDFIRFCCHLHITEMLTARGGAGETRVVWRWPERR